VTDLKKLKNTAEKEIKSVEDIISLQELFKKYLGKQGELTQILRSLKDLSKRERIMVGKEANDIKNNLTSTFENKEAELKEKEAKIAQEKEWIDITAPGKKVSAGSLHPLTLARRRAEEIFVSMGFEIAQGPDIETEWYNFDALNIPKDHPARDAWDTFYLKNGFLLRTHTSPVQVRYMEKNAPPLRVIAPGNVYRHEATDPSHEFQLQQMEGLMIGKDISAANLKAVVGEFFKNFFEKDIDFRFRPDFFPFTEPSFDISITCLFCKGKGCSVCKNSGWLEVAGAGMVHPNVLRAAGLTPKNSNSGWQGWAFGFGLERLAMLKYKINDIRLFRSGDLRFLKQF
jgi:phenylalanyl-tRNA synthetase alpha chain